MSLHPNVFVHVDGLDYVHDSYYMPALQDPVVPYDYGKAFDKLRLLWQVGSTVVFPPSRLRHHEEQVVPLVVPEMEIMLYNTWLRAKDVVGQPVVAVHGDPTLENIMALNGHAVWIDPSTRTMPLDVEFDAAKILQSYFGYETLGPSLPPSHVARHFLVNLRLNLPLTAYYLMTHLVRLYKVQPQARAWALDLATNLDARVTEALCK